MCSPPSIKYKNEWEAELGEIIPDTLWEESLASIHNCSRNVRHRLIQFKIIHRLHYSKEKLHKIYPELSPLCDRCKISPASLMHSFVSCPKIQSFWIDVFNTMSGAMAITIKPESALIILGISNTLKALNVTQQHFFSYCLIIAKKVILRHWKDAAAPTFKMWLDDLANTLHLERIRYTVQGRLEQFNKCWKPLLDYLLSSGRLQPSASIRC